LYRCVVWSKCMANSYTLLSRPGSVTEKNLYSILKTDVDAEISLHQPDDTVQ